MANIYTSIGNV